MARVYTRVFSDEAFAARLPSSQPSIVIAGGMKRVVRLKVGSEGRATALAIKQLETEGQVPFNAELLKSKVPYKVFDQDIPVATAPVDTLSLYRASPFMTAPAGFPVEFDPENLGYAYKNMDGTSTNNFPFLYLLIEPTAGGATTWKVMISVHHDLAG
jgi:hypothetical protein